MFNKVFEMEFENEFIKGYDVQQSYDILNVIYKLQECDNEINSVYLAEIGDIGMKSFEGSYSLNNFLKKYNEINRNDISNVILHINNNCNLYLGGGNYISLSSTENIELDDLFRGKPKML